MGHRLRLFTGALTVLRPFTELVPQARVFTLAPDSPFPVLPLDEQLHDALHAAYGTGDWLEEGAMLTTSDLAFASRASRGSQLAYLETAYSGGKGSQVAALWRHGALTIRPASLDSVVAGQRPRTLWPINVVLRTLGVVAGLEGDEFQALGLDRWRDSEDIIAHAAEIAVRR